MTSDLYIDVQQKEYIRSIGEFESSTWKGIRIFTTKQMITMAIENTTLCCEEWGIDITYPIASNMIGLEIIDAPRWQQDQITGEKTIVSIAVPTVYGNIVISAWNDHNGYYTHNVQVSWEDYQDTQSI
jgi:hypothetical protein